MKRAKFTIPKCPSFKKQLSCLQSCTALDTPCVTFTEVISHILEGISHQTSYSGYCKSTFLGKKKTKKEEIQLQTWGIEREYNPAYGTLSSILAVGKC